MRQRCADCGEPMVRRVSCASFGPDGTGPVVYPLHEECAEEREWDEFVCYGPSVPMRPRASLDARDYDPAIGGFVGWPERAGIYETTDGERILVIPPGVSKP